jgi:DNA-binding CsgD family transcriptional regulator
LLLNSVETAHPTPSSKDRRNAKTACCDPDIRAHTQTLNDHRRARVIAVITRPPAPGEWAAHCLPADHLVRGIPFKPRSSIAAMGIVSHGALTFFLSSLLYCQKKEKLFRAQMLEDLSAVIGLIYDASIDPTLWKSALAQIALFVGAVRGTLIIEDAAAKNVPAFFTSYDDASWIQHYFQTYLPLNPTRIAVAAYAKAGDIILTTDVMTQEEYERTRYYKEWLQQRDLVDNTVVIVDRTSIDFTVLATHRSSEMGPADETVRERLALITPHVARAVAIGRTLERTKLEAATFAEVLDRVQSAILLVNAAGYVVQANRSAREQLNTGAVLRSAQGILRMHDPEGTAALDQAIVLATAPGAAADAEVVTVPLRSSSGDRYLASILPLTSGARSRLGGHYKAVVAVFVRPIGIDLPLDPMPLASSFGLTPRELTVMITVVESGGVPETAAILGLSENTIRTHLQSIYRKTGVKNQSELSKLVASAATGLE